MPNEERAAKLAQAIELLTTVRDSFPNDTTVCECCGFARFEDWDARHMRENLSGAINRCEKTIERMGRNEGKLRHD